MTKIVVRSVCDTAAAVTGTLSEHLHTQGFEIIQSDASMSEADAIVAVLDKVNKAMLDTISQYNNNLPIMAVSNGAIDPESEWKLIGAGAMDVINTVDLPLAATMIKSRLEHVRKIEELLQQPAIRQNLIGHSPNWYRVLRQLVEMAYFSTAGVLITGESGTGKELAARLIHVIDPRPNKGKLVVLDCGTVSPDLAGSELFGHVRGAYTGAIVEREGAVSLANGGTLFLDELGELPLSVQAQLLRVIEEKAFKPVGAIKWKRSEFRLVCATNRDLKADVESGRFRLDLYHRVLAWHVHLPPLRDRADDILLLAKHFAQTETGTDELPDLDPAVERHLLQRDYPGNIRDLRQLMLRMMAHHEGPGPVTAGDVPPEDRPELDYTLRWPDAQFEQAVKCGLLNGRGMKDIGRDAEAVALSLALTHASGNTREAAQALGISERAVQMRKAGNGH